MIWSKNSVPKKLLISWYCITNALFANITSVSQHRSHAVLLARAYLKLPDIDSVGTGSIGCFSLCQGCGHTFC